MLLPSRDQVQMLNDYTEAGSPRSSRKKEMAVSVFAVLLSALLVVHPAVKNEIAQRASAIGGPIGITVGQPPFGFNVLPNSTRRIFATVTNGNTNQVTWTLKSGSATLSSNAGSWIDVTAPATGTSCSFTGSAAAGYGVRSATQFTVEATSVEDSTKRADVTFNVCNPVVEISAVPFYRTLYANQPADVQSLVLGAVDQTVHWAITLQPKGGDGKLTDSNSRDTVFSGAVPGRYHLTATSNADPKKSVTAIMYVTGHSMPYGVTPNMTEPVDCTVDPAMLGKVYDVGPSQPFKTLASVPFPTMKPGSTVRLHNEDTSGLHPTEYHEYVQIQQPATADQPFRMCGVPDSAGNLPIMDAAHATGRSDASPYAPGYGIITLHNPGNWAMWPNYVAAAYISVEGIHLRNAESGYSYVAPNGSTGQWADASACLRINQGHNTAFVGNDIDTCGNGVFTAFNADGGYGSSDINVLWEGNHLHNNGIPGQYLEHQMYLQAWGEVVQFNRIDNYRAGALGANLKSRGIQSIIRYNYMGDGASRQMDLVDVQDATALMSFQAFLSGGASSVHAIYPKNIYPADRIAAEQEAWNSHFVYGNLYLNSSAQVPIHFGEDHDGGENARKGSLYWYNNTFYEKLCPNCSGQKWTLFDTSAGGGTWLPQVEFQTVQAFNNIIWMDDPTRPVFQWNNSNAFIGVGGHNLLNSNWGTNDLTGGAGTGWNNDPQPTAYQGAENLALHITGFGGGNTLTSGAMPFDSNSWVVKSNSSGTSAVPTAMCQMPARFAYLPTLGYVVPAGMGRYNTRYSNCR
jgi:hypothetical protein